MVIFSNIVYKSQFYYMEWNRGGWLYFSVPFQIILPVIILVAAEIKKDSKTYSKKK
jgi:spore germination protein KB